MILVFAGTKDGRELVVKLLAENKKTIVSVATLYGGSLYETHPNLQVRAGKLDCEAMCKLVKEEHISKIVDITHPYAVNVTKNAVSCAQIMNIPYERIERKSEVSNIVYEKMKIVENYEQARVYVEQVSGNVLFTIGSNNLPVFSNCINKKNMYVRVLPTEAVLKKCSDLGFATGNVIAMQGPFSYDMNKLIMMEKSIALLLTKDSGNVGGFYEKVQAAIDMNIEIVVIDRPKNGEIK